MEHPDLWLKLYEDKHRDRVREVESWRLAQAARPQRARFIGQLWQRLIAVARQRWWVRVHSKPAKPDLANLPR